jgi:hypothetical protein
MSNYLCLLVFATILGLRAEIEHRPNKPHIKDKRQMTHRELQTAIKTLRDSGVLGTPALNSKAIVLQAWLESYNRKQAITVEEVPEPVIYEVETVNGTLTLATNHESAEEFINSGILENCVNVENWDCGDVRTFNTDTLYCELPTRNIAAEYIADNAPDYWNTWDTAYTTAIASLKPLTPALIAIPAHIPTSVNHGVPGMVTIVIMLEAWQLVATLLIPLISQSFYTIRKTAIYTTLVVDGFKQALILARKTLQTA